MQICTRRRSELLEPVVIYEDNKAAMSWSQNPVSMTNMKPIDRDLKWIRKAVEEKTIASVRMDQVRETAGRCIHEGSNSISI